MKIKTILDHIDNGHMALPKFQRDYVWTRKQVTELMVSLYKKYPIGSMLVWGTQFNNKQQRGKEKLSSGIIKLLLDGQQRIFSLYGVINGKCPSSFVGKTHPFIDFYFNIETEKFSFGKKKDSLVWINVSTLMKKGNQGIGNILKRFLNNSNKLGEYAERLSKLLSILETDIHIEEVIGKDKTIDVVVEIFNIVNSGGTKLSKGDLALAKICSEYPKLREDMHIVLKKWEAKGYTFTMDWLLRNITAIVTGNAKYSSLHNVSIQDIKDGLIRATKSINFLLKCIDERFGLNHDKVLFGKYAFPVMSYYIDQKGGFLLNKKELDKLLFWYLNNAVWGRFSGSTTALIDRDLKSLKLTEGGVDTLIKNLLLERGTLKIEPEHFMKAHTKTSKLRPILYLLAYVSLKKDSSIKRKLEGHNIFPTKLLKYHGYATTQINAIANFYFLTKPFRSDGTLPNHYFSKINKLQEGVLKLQHIPTDKTLLEIDNYPEFLKVRCNMLAKVTNDFMDSLFDISTINN